MPRRQKGDTSVATQAEVRDLRKDIELIAKGTLKVKAGYDEILGTITKITEAQKKDYRWLKKTVDKEKELAELGKSITKMATKKSWHIKSWTKWTEYRGILEVKSIKNARKKKGLEGEVEDELIGQAEALWDGLGNAQKLISAANDLDSMFGGMGATIAGFVTNPLTAVSALLLTFMEMQQEIADQFGAMGMREFQGELHNANINATKLGYSFSDVATTTTTLASDFGIAFDKAVGMNDSVLGLARATATGVDGAATLMGMFTVIGGHSADSAENLLLSAEAMAVANDMAPGEILDQIAGSTETFASFAQKGGENIIRAAMQAKKLGTNLDTVGGIAKGMLNFQDSLNKEIEAGILLGRDINFQRARELALAGDLEGMMDSILDQVGGEARWNELNVIQRQAMADALGVDLLTMGKLVSKEKEAATLQGKMAEFQAKNPIPEEALTSTAELLNNLKALGMEMATKLGPIIERFVKFLGGMVEWLGEGDRAMNMMRTAIGLYVGKIGIAIGQTVALMMANLGLMTSKMGAATFGVGIPIALGLAGGVIGWLASNSGAAENAVGSAQEGGITTQEGLINVHPQEAIVPVEKLGGMLVSAMDPIYKETKKNTKVLEAMLGPTGLLAPRLGMAVAAGIMRSDETI